MNVQEFDQVMQEIVEEMKSLSRAKSAEYSSDADKLENFRDAAALDHGNELQALWGMLIKHIVSMAKFFRENRDGKQRPLVQWHEKLGDIRVYTVLVEAILRERDAAATRRVDVDSKTYRDIVREAVQPSNPMGMGGIGGRPCR